MVHHFVNDASGLRRIRLFTILRFLVKPPAQHNPLLFGPTNSTSGQSHRYTVTRHNQNP